MTDFNYESLDEITPDLIKEMIQKAGKELPTKICFKCGELTNDISKYPHYCHVCFDVFLHPSRISTSVGFHEFQNQDCPITMEPLSSYEMCYISPCCNNGFSYDAVIEYCKIPQAPHEDLGILPITCPLCRAPSKKFLRKNLKYKQ